MKKYHKIDTVFKRDPATGNKRLIIGDYSRPEFEYLAENQWVFTEKVDGTNIRVIIDPPAERDKLRFAGRSDDAQMPPKLLSALMNQFRDMEAALLAQFPEGGCLYGEGYGATIQKGGGNYRADQGFVMFDIKVGEWWLERLSVEQTGGQFGILTVPIIGSGTLAQMIGEAQKGFNSTWGPFLSEGIVARPATELRGRDGKRVITKIKHKDFA